MRWMRKWGISWGYWEKQLGAGALGRDRANGGGLGSKEHQGLKCKFRGNKWLPSRICTLPGTGNSSAWAAQAVPDLLSGISPIGPGDTHHADPLAPPAPSLASSMTLEDSPDPQN